MRWGRNWRPVHHNRQPGQANPLFIYPFVEWRETLEGLRRSEEPHPHDAYLMEFAFTRRSAKSVSMPANSLTTRTR